jgi:hypothetical protein
MSPLVWTTKSTRNLAGALTRMGHAVSDRTVAWMLAGLGFSLQGNAKVSEGRQHEDRDAQFRYINDRVSAYLAAGLPVVSVDAKKVGGCEEEGAGRGFQERRPLIPAHGLAGAGERARLHGHRTRQGDPLRHL